MAVGARDKEFERHRGGKREKERERAAAEVFGGVVELGDLVSVVTSRTG